MLPDSQYDSRAAMMAKDRMHNFPLAGRPVRSPHVVLLVCAPC